ncbi:complement receptor type 1-like isoform X4 [Sphaerodactylus townsendi]|uniref:complement receptor type 1-like isoform X4 n=1 Tax=Sphaerodactylus townsendi TaxID=933632 RepID=UPI0020262FB5|nr:complement receptor type 1-like isoform X4 [Sphaerodactylus townsendi]
MLCSWLSSAGPVLFVALSLFSGTRGDCGIPPELNNAIPQRNIHAETFPVDTKVIYKCLDGFFNIHGKIDVTTCLSNSQWTPIEEFCESSCPVPESLIYAVPKPEEVTKNYYTPGTTVTYVCRRGYDSIPGMSPVITCLQNNSWSEVPIFCRGKSCGDPGKPENGRVVIVTDLLYRSKVNFICDDGYQLIGSPFTQCSMKSNAAKWDKEPPDCQPITCSSPPNITGGTHDGGGNNENFPYNSTVTYKCKNGFSLIGDASIHCTTEDNIKGIWRGAVPECQGDCGRPKQFPNAQLRTREVKDSYPVGTRLSYGCLPGYELASSGRPVITCHPNSQWSDISVVCQGRRCPIPDIENGRIVEDSDLRLGAEITFACYEGHRAIGQNGARCVLREGGVIWSHEPPYCERIPCFPPPTIAHGVHDGRDVYSYGTAVTYRCNSPYSLIGSRTIVCLSDQDQNGKWNQPAPECRVVRCGVPEVSNGLMRTSYRPSYTYQDRVIFECVSGYRLKDNRGDAFCGANSTWQPHLPECIPGVPPTTTPGGDVEDGTLPASTSENPSGNDLGHTERPTLPPDESGSNSIPVIVGAVCGCIAVVVICCAALGARVCRKKQRKTGNAPAPPESYTAVPPNIDISLEEPAKTVKL